MHKIHLTLLLALACSSVYAQPGQLEKKLAEGVRQLQESHTDSAEQTFKEVATQAAAENNIRLLVKAKSNTGRIYSDRGDNVKAIAIYQEALSQAENIDDKKLIASVEKNIGVLYVQWKKFDQALEHYNKAESLARAVNDQELIADCQNNKGIVYEQRTEYDQAIEVYKNALELYTQKNIPAKIAMTISNLAIVSKFQKKYDEALAYNFKSIALSEASGDKWNIAATYNNIGNLYGEIGDYEKAISYCEKALVIAKEIDAQEIIESIYDSMADAAAKAGDYKNAFAYHKLFSEALNGFINAENSKQLTELNIKYESEKKQQLIQQQQFEISRRNNWLVASSIIVLLLCVTIWLGYRTYRQRQEKKLQQEIFKQQEMATAALFEGEQKERIRLARDLHDGVGQKLSLVKMSLAASGVENEATIKAVSLVDQTIDEVRNVSHNLIPEELNFGLFAALDNLADKVNEPGSIRMETEISEKARLINTDKQRELSIYRIAQEVVSNMIKHADASLIKLSVDATDNSMLISISDNGKGMDQSAIAKSNGIGLKNIYTRVHLLDGTISINSSKSTGTKIDLKLPAHG